MGTKKLFRAVMATVVGVIGFVLFSASPAGATYFVADRQCDGTVEVQTYGVGAGLHVELSAHGVTWELWPGDEATVTLPPVDGDTVFLVSDYEYEDGTTWTTEYSVPISPPPGEQCAPPETPAPPTTPPPVQEPPVQEPPPPADVNPSWAVEPFCRNDTPYLSVTALLPADLAGQPITLHWVDSSGTERHTQAVAAGTTEVLWPGAVVDGNGNPTDWPGWVEESGVWLEADDGFAWARTASVFLSANPTSPTFPASYPPATPTCSARPVIEILRASATPTGAPTLPETGAGAGPLVVLGVVLLAAGGALVAATRQRPAATSRS
jgi:LPXTG-motif cell wall-anchored protein